MAISSSSQCPTNDLLLSSTCNSPGPAVGSYCISAANECGTTSVSFVTCDGSSMYQRIQCMYTDTDDDWPGDVMYPIDPNDPIILTTPDVLLNRR